MAASRFFVAASLPKAASQRRTLREICNRLAALTQEERDFFLHEADRGDQLALLWLATCRAYRFVREFAVEVLRERYLSFQLDLSLDSVLVPALLRYLADTAPQAQVHVFDDSRDPLDENGQPALRDDSPSMALLRASLLAFAAGQPVARAQRPLSGGDGAHT